MTILAVGTRKFIPQLQELAHGANTQVAEWASQKLKQIDEEITNSTWAY